MELITLFVVPVLPFIASLGLLIGAVVYLIVRSKKSKSTAVTSAVVTGLSVITILGLVAVAVGFLLIFLALRAFLNYG